MDIGKAYRIDQELRLKCLSLLKVKKSLHVKKIFKLFSVRVVNSHFMIKTEFFNKPGTHVPGTNNKNPHATFLSL